MVKGEALVGFLGRSTVGGLLADTPGMGNWDCLRQFALICMQRSLGMGLNEICWARRVVPFELAILCAFTPGR